MLTKRHFIAIGNIILRQTERSDGYISKEALVASLINYFAAENVNFDPDKFHIACFANTKGGGNAIPGS